MKRAKKKTERQRIRDLIAHSDASELSEDDDRKAKKSPQRLLPPSSPLPSLPSKPPLERQLSFRMPHVANPLSRQLVRTNSEQFTSTTPKQRRLSKLMNKISNMEAKISSSEESEDKISKEASVALGQPPSKRSITSRIKLRRKAKPKLDVMELSASVSESEDAAKPAVDKGPPERQKRIKRVRRPKQATPLKSEAVKAQIEKIRELGLRGKKKFRAYNTFAKKRIEKKKAEAKTGVEAESELETTNEISIIEDSVDVGDGVNIDISSYDIIPKHLYKKIRPGDRIAWITKGNRMIGPLFVMSTSITKGNVVCEVSSRRVGKPLKQIRFSEKNTKIAFTEKTIVSEIINEIIEKEHSYINDIATFLAIKFGDEFKSFMNDREQRRIRPVEKIKRRARRTRKARSLPGSKNASEGG